MEELGEPPHNSRRQSNNDNVLKVKNISAKDKLEKGPKPVKDKKVNVGPWWVTEERKPSTMLIKL